MHIFTFIILNLLCIEFSISAMMIRNALKLKSLHRSVTALNFRLNHPLRSKLLSNQNNTRQFSLYNFLKSTDQSSNQNHRNFNNSKFHNAHCWFIGIGAALANHLQNIDDSFQCQEKEEIYQYINSREEQKKKYYAYIMAQPWGAAAKTYIEKFEAQEQMLFDELFAICEITRSDWQKFISSKEFGFWLYEATQSLKNQTCLNGNCNEVSKEIRLKFQEFFKKFDIRLSTIELIQSIKDDFVMKSTRDHIYVKRKYDKQYVKAINENIRVHNKYLVEHVMLHEIVHLIHDDMYVHYCLMLLLNQTPAIKVDKKIKDDFMMKYMHFREMRADILAALSDKKYAQECAKELNWDTSWLNYIISAGDVPSDFVDPEHPTRSTQKMYMNKLVKDMNEAGKKPRKWLFF
jgi:hypothetical protein